MNKGKTDLIISITIIAILILTNIATVTGYTVHEDGTWTMLDPEHDCHTFGTVEDSYFTNPACKELTDQIFTCLEGCYSGIEYKPEYIDLYGPYYCEEICYPICEVQIYPDNPLIPECGGNTLLPEEDQATLLTTQTVQDELIQEQCRDTCRKEYGPMTLGKTNENTPRIPQKSLLGYIDECVCSCEKGTIYENRIVTKPYCGEVYDDKINYCGPAGKFSVPRKPVGMDFNRACYNHDLCYETTTPQKTCDKNMLIDMRKACNQATGLKRFVCLGFARIYYHSVSSLGSWIGTKS